MFAKNVRILVNEGAVLVEVIKADVEEESYKTWT